MIKSVYSKSRNGEVLDVLDAIISAYDKSALTTDPNLVSVFEKLKPLSVLMVAALASMKAESTLEEADVQRDNKTRGLFFGVQSFLYADNALIKTAAEQINAVLTNYGMDLITENYAVESSIIKSMLNDLADPSLSEAIAAVPGCSLNISQLQAAQDAFTSAFNEFEAAKAAESQEKSATELKKEVVNLLNKTLVRYLNGMQAVNAESYNELAHNIGQIIADNNSKVLRRNSSVEE